MTCIERPTRSAIKKLGRTIDVAGIAIIVLALGGWVIGAFPDRLPNGEVIYEWYTVPFAGLFAIVVGIFVGAGGVWYYFTDVDPEEQEESS